MKSFMTFLLQAGLVFLCTYSSLAQDYPHWLNDPYQKFNEYPTAIASAPDVVATVGFYEEEFYIDDLDYNTFYGVPCLYCNQKENIFVNWHQVGTNNTWAATISTDKGVFNNQVNVQSVPQVDITNTGDVYVSFTYKEDIVVEDASGGITMISGNSTYDIAVVKFDASGNYQWHITEGGESEEFITDLDYNENTGRLAIGAYIEGNSDFLLDNTVWINSGSAPSVLGGSFNYGNAFAAVYKDNGGSASLTWVSEVEVASYSTDVVQDDAGNVFLSGLYSSKTSAVKIAGLNVSGQFATGDLKENYFLVGFEQSAGTPMWAESYGSFYNELTIAPSKHLRYSSLAIIPQSSALFYAFMSTGEPASAPPFQDFGTYANAIDPSNGVIISSMIVGNINFANTNTTNYPQVHIGSPTYNPNIAVDQNENVYIAGNILLTNNSTSILGLGFEDIAIGTTYLHHNMTAAGIAGASTSTIAYTAMIDFNNLTVYKENLNSSYIPAINNNVYNQLPVYGIAEDIDNSDHFFHILGFKQGIVELDLTTNIGVTNPYDNTSNGSAQYDGLIMRSHVKNGQLSKRGIVSTPTTQNTASADKSKATDLEGATSTWLLSPNPVAAGQSLLWKSEGEEVVDYIRLIDLTGRVVQEWKQPKATAQGFQLSINKLVTGTYLLEASGTAVQQSTLITVE